MSKKHSIVLGIIFAASAVIIRLIPHPWNFAPVGALVLYSGFILPRRYIILPLIVLFFSDLIIGTYQPYIMAAVYASYGLSMGLSFSLRKYYGWSTILGASLAGSLAFFFVTNAAVWLWSGMYPVTGAGLITSYVAGLPFFRNTIISDLFFSGVFFGMYELAGYFIFLISGVCNGKPEGRRFPRAQRY